MRNIEDTKTKTRHGSINGFLPTGITGGYDGS
jgi:hypothetical protein